ncbi:FAD-dependent monooxygenase [Mesorhizobium sp. PAMC28654]|uniref:FAD-dependent monooxygenase n=1 Tax=Mesorhizobium sp. PAMC28654 TaxID=2880934 RepID=UPI001D0BE14B|nr:FAD-dependent monooxygenase [Mesorhizobium sp. PAMC28654]UDL90985.1 FAD-dependent monooxygenase [Mesorhizobium sp. PAMC28654]
MLISGAGIAGPTLAYWLARHGFSPTVVERSGAVRSSGSPVDVRGPALEVALRMNIMPRIREAGTDVAYLSFVDARGKRVGRINMRALRQAAGSQEVELPRGDLASILYEASRSAAEFLFNNAIAGISQDEHGVDVTFENGPPRRFDLVIGADGLHSAVRRLAFGPESDFVDHMGLYIATLHLDSAERGNEVVVYNTPGTAISIHPSTGHALVAFLFHSPAEPGFDHRDIARHKRILEARFAHGSWRTRELIDRVRAADDLYFDSVSQVHLDQWWRGRVVLLGDAASSLSLFGEGSTLAMAGAFTLAEELAANPGDHRTAFRNYEARHRILVAPKQRGSWQAAALLVPRTRLGISARNLATRLWPLGAAAAWLLVSPHDRRHIDLHAQQHRQ